MSRPPFPSVIDSSMRATFVACPQHFYREYLQHWRNPRPSIHLVAGGAFAKGIETTRFAYFAHGASQSEALGLGLEALIREYGTFEPESHEAKTCETMCLALAEYFTIHGLDTDEVQPLMLSSGIPAVEFSFALPIGITHPESGDPLLYAGRFDMLGLYNGALFAVDEKTTSSLGASWHKNWRLRSQLTGYCWAAREYGYPVAGAIIRGLSILKTSFGHAESIQYRPDWMIARWMEQLHRDVTRMIQCWHESYWDFNLDSSCTSYGGCPFLEICSSHDPERWLEADFVKREWSPLTHTPKEPSA